MKIVRRLAILCGIIVLGVSACVAQNPTVSANGEGTVTVSADVTIITVSAESNNQNATLAAADAQNKLNKAEDVLIAAGVNKQEIFSGQASSTSSLQYSGKVCRLVNNTTVCDVTSTAANKIVRSFSVRINTTEQERINDIINAAKSTGADASVTGYSLSNPKDAIAEAKKSAVQNAKENAEAEASAAGGSIGKVLDISDYGAYPSMSMTQPGMVDVTSYVIVTYQMTV
ncbi:MAG: SIMPL domain-containing protein [Methanotrichaceae archaeon]